MATVTPNFSWPVPTSTDLVKDGATAIEALGDSIDASLVDLKGGTTGQVLSKNSNTDMDFTWVTDAAGDITGVTAGTGITGGGTSGTVTVSFDQANFGGGQYAAGKNKIINGDYGVWQRGTSFSPVADVPTYTADRFIIQRNGVGYTATCSRQTFTSGTAPVSGYEGQFFWRYAVTVAGTSNTYVVADQRIEDVRTLAGQTATISFWAKADSARAISGEMVQDFGSGGSGAVATAGGSFSLTTSWTRFTATVSIPSITGKTVGTNSYLTLRFYLPSGALTPTIDIWGVQLEAGSTATPFQTATGTKQGELAACQRYYFRQSLAAGATSGSAFGSAKSTTVATMVYSLPVTMRVPATSGEYANVRLWDGANVFTVTSAVFSGSTEGFGTADFGVASGLTQFRPYQIIANASLAGYVAFSAEL
jgi:hypothetical protein